MQASNVATYIAHGDVALSVLMTTASTLGAIIMTPLLTKTLAGTLMPVDAKASSQSLLSALPMSTHDKMQCTSLWGHHQSISAAESKSRSSNVAHRISTLRLCRGWH